MEKKFQERSVKMKKKVDALGRIGIPKKIRDDMGLRANTCVSIDYNAEEKSILLKLHTPSCIVCGNTEKLLALKNNLFLCSDCLQQLK